MHLHGFYFVVEATGDIGAERRLAPGQQRTAVTELVKLWPDVRDVMDTRNSGQLVVSLPHDAAHERT